MITNGLEFQNPENESAVTPHDTNELSDFGVIYAAGAGNIKYKTVGGQTHTKAVAAGGYIPVKVRLVFATDTTATGITVLY